MISFDIYSIFAMGMKMFQISYYKDFFIYAIIFKD